MNFSKGSWLLLRHRTKHQISLKFSLDLRMMTLKVDANHMVSGLMAGTTISTVFKFHTKLF
jgi:hypothetical protein